jgi:hypothetical protein
MGYQVQKIREVCKSLHGAILWYLFIFLSNSVQQNQQERKWEEEGGFFHCKWKNKRRHGEMGMEA